MNAPAGGRSFQTRIILLTLAVGAASLAASLAGGWSIALANLEQRKEAELAAEASRLAPRLLAVLAPLRPAGPRPPARQSIEEVVEDLADSGFEVAAFDAEHHERARSPGFPASVDALALARRATPLPPQRPPGPEGDRPPPPGPPDTGLPPPWRPPTRGGPTPGGPEPAGRPPDGRPELRVGPPRVVQLEGGAAETHRAAIVALAGGVAVFVRSRADEAPEERATLIAFLVPLPVGLMLLGVGAAWAARRAVAPVRALTELAEGISAAALDRRLTAPAADRELARLTAAFNAMLDRIERGVVQARRFSADAAHELNTPLTILRGHLDQALQSAAPGSEEQQRTAVLIEEVQRLTLVVEKLLLLSRAEAGLLRLERRPTDLRRLLAEVLAEVVEAHPTITFAPLPEGPAVPAEVDTTLVRQILFNLLHNAARHNRPAGQVRAQVAALAGALRIEISNTGGPVPGDVLARLFDRFHRGDPARSRGGGLGLGLALAREFARLHGGTVALARNEPDDVRFEVVLPMSS